MSEIDEQVSHIGFDAEDHQIAYVYNPAKADDEPLTRPSKRRKVAKTRISAAKDAQAKLFRFDCLINGLESQECADLRQTLFENSWSATEVRIQSILNEANEDTLTEVTTFINASYSKRQAEKVPTGFVVTGPNITSQGLLFNQLAAHLKSEVNGPVVILRSGDASNLKAILKQLLRDATNQKLSMNDDEDISAHKDGRKLLNYDLEILHEHVESHGSQAVVIAFQDSEAFDSNLMADLISLFSSWSDRIPFLLLFGIATSVDLFNERLSRSASRSLKGRKFDVEQTSSQLERIFQTAVSGAEASLRLGTKLVSELIERQQDHFQSVQSFVEALKYSYMCHFYGNPLSILNDVSTSSSLSKLLQSPHFELIRMLPSFKSLIEGLVEAGDMDQAHELLKDDNILLQKVTDSLESRNSDILRILRAMHMAVTCFPEPVPVIELYMTTFEGKLSESDLVKSVLENIKRMAPEDFINFIRTAIESTKTGSIEKDLVGWMEEEPAFIRDLSEIQSQVSSILEDSQESGRPVRSSYAIHSTGVRTTVIAQRVQLSYEKSSLSNQDKEFTALVDRLSQLLISYFTLESPQNMFLNEVWLFNSTSPYRDYFTPRPRAVIERALSAPYDYLNCECCEAVEGLSSTHPATALLYQMYLETGLLINIYDLWSAFFEMLNGGEEQKMDERDALVLFYRALADLKSLGMVKQSKKKADHLAKLAWKGL
ncbi:hypothetical protein WAI453_013319 [Rhynchosporium graminicola]|uniref:Origin recognition complex subunit 3 n=1 Tax=Rhynchosporium graminicola TaxID=2792576 RepID=A0A1E1K956_9HELO|nr:related to origin recognition complex subunit 3 [Rhynchosporium commune]